MSAGRRHAAADEQPGGRPQAAATFRDRLESYRPDLVRLLLEQEEPAYRFAQVYEHLTRRPGVPWQESTSLPAGLRSRLAPFGQSSLRVARRADDDEGTTKLVLRTQDGLLLESVVMRYRRGVTLCLSSQIGCALGCTFCATGAMGFKRNLSTAEILDQVQAAQALLGPEGRHASDIVFMGMGEPLLNLSAVLPALGLLHDPDGLAFSRRSLSVSTIGIPAGIRRLARDEPQVNLALSLHAADDALRRRLMPAARRYPLHQVLEACEEHFRLTRRKLFVEYLLIGGVNDRPRHAERLAALVRARVAVVNLIPWNPTCEGYEAPEASSVRAFAEQLRARGVEVTVRDSRGWSIAAACGQLAGDGEREKRRPGSSPAPGSTPVPAGRRGGHSAGTPADENRGRARRGPAPSKPKKRRERGG
jgi:23S rRNA (adenine2503-C2)-methyltransferase